jgi:cell division protein FtsW
MEQILRKYFKGDRIIWYVIAALSLISMLVIYSATANLAVRHSSGSAIFFLFRHAVFLSIGIGLIVVIHKIPYKWFSRASKAMLFVAVGLLGVALVSGTNLNNAARWITLPIVGLTFQPSEFAKIALMIYLAKVLAIHQEEKITLNTYMWQLLMPIGIVTGLIFTEDLSTAVLIGGASMVMMFIGRVPFKYLFYTALAAIVFFFLILFISRFTDFSIFHRAATWRMRIVTFIADSHNVFADALRFILGNETLNAVTTDSDFQASKSQLAIVNGGIFGQGPGNSLQRYFLPHPYSDFVFAIIVEEWGLLGGFLVLLAYMVLLYRAGVIVRNSNKVFPALLVVGLTITLVFQAIINMGVAVGLLPVTGQTLPLVSMGGTSILFSCLALGMILSVSRYIKENNDETGETPAADTAKQE